MIYDGVARPVLSYDLRQNHFATKQNKSFCKEISTPSQGVLASLPV
jgi:hypothetical protein